VTTDDADLAQRIQVLRNYGSSQKDFNAVRGYNSRLDPLQAAFLRVRLGHLDAWNLRRQALAELYMQGLRGAGCTLPAVPDWTQPVWHQFVVRHSQRDRLREHLAGRGIQTAIHYPIPPHLSEAYADHSFAGSGFPRTEELARTVLSLPMNPHLQADEAQQVCRAIVEFTS
jgi:dTDP-4-amino-4,6-dideoxygalactose transaminase